ncbi:DNA-(apurinic or apyrimidinic site) lyase, putative [Eimeria necatrix]|uniref:DNA-(Apurinic or apyrimidinic site) lyase, putative n=1 Tax=Eimeria necatrix TaxID=51315 RepID=U6MWX0_9EIME|nr:DNA-(apurinic or apyrimidinic site) lyase, putative [Eimeria necatrix]CDJ66205.1 DNA-(apurinic or apyrimidinic site) lyase, putative [Eimeria necatrix]
MRSQFVPLTTMVLPRKALPTAKPKAASAGAAAASQSQPLTSASPPVEVINIEDNKEENRAEKEGNSISSQGDSRKRSRDTRPTRDNGATKVKRPASLLGLREEPTPDPSSVIRSSVIELSPVLAADPTPVSFLTWNANGLMPRVRASQWVQFAKYANEVKPDVICLQEIRLPAMGPAGCRKGDGKPRDRGAVRVEPAASASAAEKRETQAVGSCLREALAAFPDYNVLMSLADWKYSGQFLLLRRHLKVAALRFNLDEEDPDIHHAEGRVIIADFGRLAFLTTYSPNNGWTQTSFQRRRQWDDALLKFMERQKKPLIWMGDINCAPSDADLSHPKVFRSAHQPDPNLKPEDVGQPGCTDAERHRLEGILRAGQRNPRTTPPPVQHAAYTWRGYSEDWSPSSARAMRLDHAFASEELLPCVTSIEIVGKAFPRLLCFCDSHRFRGTGS